MDTFFRDYADNIVRCLEKLPDENLARATDILKNAIRGGKQIIVFGNGGSAATASHFVCDLAKGMTTLAGVRVKAISLNDCVPLMTAWANDESYESVFQQPLVNYLKEGDVVIGISASGNSPNVLKAIEYANAHGGVTMGWSGMGGGKLAKLVKYPIVVASDSYEEVEDVHLIITHMVKMGLTKTIKDDQG